MSHPKNQHPQYLGTDPPPVPMTEAQWKKIKTFHSLSQFPKVDPPISTGELRWILGEKRGELDDYLYGCVQERYWMRKYGARAVPTRRSGESHSAEQAESTNEQKPPTVVIWAELLQFALPRKVRKKVYKLTLEEIKKDYYEAWEKYSNSRYAMFFIQSCFCFRTALCFVECLARGYSGILAELFRKKFVNILSKWFRFK
jgi:hypothetical protein